MRDLRTATLTIGLGTKLVGTIASQMHDFDVLLLAEPADVVRLPVSVEEKRDGINGMNRM
jgi:hypothetical protein